MNNETSKISEPMAENPLLPVRAANKECFHNWEYGYIADLIIYCTECNKELDEVYDEQDVSYKTHTCKNGKLIEKE